MAGKIIGLRIIFRRRKMHVSVHACKLYHITACMRTKLNERRSFIHLPNAQLQLYQRSTYYLCNYTTARGLACKLLAKACHNGVIALLDV